MDDSRETVVFYREVIGGDTIEYMLTHDPRLGLQLYINSGLQFTERDEYRYHQLVFSLPFVLSHAMGKKDAKVLVLGGGDGLGVKHINELCDAMGVERPRIDLVDISKTMIHLSTTHPEMVRVNGNSMNSENLKLHVEDGVEFVRRRIRMIEEAEGDEEKASLRYDLVIQDYPDPVTLQGHPLNYLFSEEHLRECKRVLLPEGVMASQSTSVIVSPNTFRLLTLNYADVFENILQIKINIRTFEDIGVLIGADRDLDLTEREIAAFDHLFFSHDQIPAMQTLFKDEIPDFPDEVIRLVDISELMRFDFSRVKMF